MSTDYFFPREPISSLRLEEGPHDRLSIWEGGALAGTLTVSSGSGRRLARLLAEDQPAFHTYYGGESVGCVVTEVGDRRFIDGAACLISDGGEVLTAAEVRAFAGAGRREKVADAGAS